MREKEKENEVFAVERYEDLEGLYEIREKAQEHSCRYRQRMTEAYGMMTKECVHGRATCVKGSRLRQARHGRTI